MPRDTSVYKRANRPCWYISYFCPQKLKRVHEATHWRTDDPAGHKHALRRAHELSQQSAAYRGAAKNEVWSAWADRYLVERYRRQPKTLRRYQGAWDWIRLYIEERQLAHPQAVTYNHVLDYITWRCGHRRHCGKPISRNTALVEVKVWGVVFREAVRRGFALTNPCLQLGIKRDQAPEKAEITDEEAAFIRQRLAEKEGHLPITEQWMTTCFAIAMHHGCRLSETAIPMSAIDFARETIRITAKGKNGQAKVFTNRIHPGIMPLLKALRDAKAPATCVLPQMASKEWFTLLKGHEKTKHLCFHSTRVTVITRLARAGVPVQQAMRYVGHASETVHRIYQRLKAEDLTACSLAISYGEGSEPPKAGTQGDSKSIPESSAAL